MQSKIYFAHANGIPAAVYQSLWQCLQDTYQVSYLPIVGMNAAYPVSLHWEALVDEVLEDMQQRYGNEAVIGVGHSFGALLLWRCAFKRPERFTQLVLMDPPIMMGMRAMVFEPLQYFKLKMADKFSPAGVTLRRRDTWQHRDEAYQSLRHNRLFQHFEEACFADYMQHGLVATGVDETVTLRIPKRLEAEIFRQFPVYWWRKPSVALNLPVHLLAASGGLFYQQGHTTAFTRKFGIQQTVVQGGHMFPLEQVAHTADLLRQILCQKSA
ncbi:MULTISPECIES: alpha/beta fold hydrolase [Vitreoscilla]|uniref:Alpha/beta hydrolase n=1 Tax=Vitreoscilla stercoraria TaxID=61 RepID=A0ABY4E767_VITST|nr:MULTISPECIES: alpha/beta hydrolase [Vitreoscilla]AUZ04702.1 alpha/beta hydrolase family protein [Vitreoscilla sp. C1]UOO91612.1 alpha/beta hydrolase [Vitreoscilla stercoraria]